MSAVRTEKRRDYERKYYAANRDMLCERQRQLRAKNPHRSRAACRKWRKNNPETFRGSVLHWENKHPGDHLKRSHKYYAKNKRKIHARRKRRYHSDPQHRIQCVLSRRIVHAVRAASARKSNKTRVLIGCTPEFLRDYLQTRFESGMSWENYPTWHIDHRIPVAKFNLIDPDEQRKCFHYSNLQPMWAKENIRKGDGCPGEHQAELL